MYNVLSGLITITICGESTYESSGCIRIGGRIGRIDIRIGGRIATRVGGRIATRVGGRIATRVGGRDHLQIFDKTYSKGLLTRIISKVASTPKANTRNK